MSTYKSPISGGQFVNQAQRGVPAKGGLSPHLHSNTRMQKYRHIQYVVQNWRIYFFQIARLINHFQKTFIFLMSCTYMSIYKSPISGGQFVNQPPKRDAGERRLIATLAQQHQSAKV